MNSMTPPMPALFLGHGNPMHALVPGPLTRIWGELGQRLPVPEAILVISAHWQTPVPAVTAMALPRTIHDFGGFPKALYQIRYRCPGHPDLAREIIDTLSSEYPIVADQDWGLDHGAWSLLKYLYPDANIPVLQLSLATGMSVQEHYAFSTRLKWLRKKGVLILGSGNIVHHLGMLQWEETAPTHEWAIRFDQKVRTAIREEDQRFLLNPGSTNEGKLAVPTLEHYLPLLYVLGVASPEDTISFPAEGIIELGAISMTSVLLEYAPPPAR